MPTCPFCPPVHTLLLLQVQRLGVCSLLVPTSVGLCCKTFKQGLDKYAAHAAS
jgi:hypothetical protein